MGQYFLIANIDKREWINPHELGSGVKFLEAVYNDIGGVLLYLTRQSDNGGGGDVGPNDDAGSLLGRWAGDRITFVGDYDSSNLYDEACEQYANITPTLRREWNTMVYVTDGPDMLRHHGYLPLTGEGNPCGWANDHGLGNLSSDPKLYDQVKVALILKELDSPEGERQLNALTLRGALAR